MVLCTVFMVKGHCSHIDDLFAGLILFLPFHIMARLQSPPVDDLEWNIRELAEVASAVSHRGTLNGTLDYAAIINVFTEMDLMDD